MCASFSPRNMRLSRARSTRRASSSLSWRTWSRTMAGSSPTPPTSLLVYHRNWRGAGWRSFNDDMTKLWGGWLLEVVVHGFWSTAQWGCGKASTRFSLFVLDDRRRWSTDLNLKEKNDYIFHFTLFFIVTSVYFFSPCGCWASYINTYGCQMIWIMT